MVDLSIVRRFRNIIIIHHNNPSIYPPPISGSFLHRHLAIRRFTDIRLCTFCRKSARLKWINGCVCYQRSWWRHQMETFSALLAICAGNSPVTGEFPAQRPVSRSFGVCFDLRLNKRLSKQWWGWWFETPLRPLWHHCNVVVFVSVGVGMGMRMEMTVVVMSIMLLFLYHYHLSVYAMLSNLNGFTEHIHSTACLSYTKYHGNALSYICT